MHENDSISQGSTPSRSRRTAVKVALVGAGLAAGVIGATAVGASAASSDTTSAATTTTLQSVPAGAAASGTASSGTAQAPRGPGGATPVRSDESTLSVALTAKLKAAALTAVPGGTVVRVESDAGDATYEAHMTKADGDVVTVKFDASGAVTAVEQGMGQGDPAPSR